MTFHRSAACADSGCDDSAYPRLSRGSVVAGKYIVLESIGEGERSATYACRCLHDAGQLVALKMLLPHAAHDAGAVAAFAQEYRLAKLIDHPHVLQVYDWIDLGDSVAYTLEYALCGTLAEVLPEGRSLSVPEIETLGRQMCTALEAVHRAGLVHNNFGLHSVYVMKDGRLKLGGFGPALAPASGKTVREDRIHGHLDYVSPEYVRNGTIHAASDVYALGIVLYELTTGRYPFERLSSPVESLRHRLSTDAPAPVYCRAACPAPLNRVIINAMRREWQNRLSSIAEVAQELHELSSGQYAFAQPGLAVKPVKTTRQGCGILGARGASADSRDQGLAVEPRILPYLVSSRSSGNTCVRDIILMPAAAFCCLYLLVGMGFYVPRTSISPAVMPQTAMHALSAEATAYSGTAGQQKLLRAQGFVPVTPEPVVRRSLAADFVRKDLAGQAPAAALRPVRDDLQERANLLAEMVGQQQPAFRSRAPLPGGGKVAFSQLEFSQSEAEFKRLREQCARSSAGGTLAVRCSQLDFDKPRS